MKMSIFEDTDRINAILAGMVDDGMAEPIDFEDCHPLDWAEVVGIADEIFDDMYPEAEMTVDENGTPWYVS